MHRAVITLKAAGTAIASTARMRTTLAAALASLFVIGLGCGFAGSPVSGGGAGVTPGGAQDIGLAREKIANGIVPNPEDFAAEGLYSEHDLPLDGPPCTETLCLRAAAAVAPAVDTGEGEVFIQLGMSSNVDPATFQRPKLNAALVIDRSCSMEGGRFEDVKHAAKALVDRLGPDDLLTLVTFDERAKHELGPKAVTDREALKREIDALKIGGSTCIECGLKEAHARVKPKIDPSRQTRLFLFTDALPNVGATGEGEFIDLLEKWGAKGVYVTTFGVGVDFGQELVTRMSKVRGANYFFLRDGEPVRKVFDEDFAFLVTPIAYDFGLALTPAAPLQLVASYGIPGEPGATSAQLSVSSLFLSRRRGAIVVRLRGDVQPQSQLAQLQLGYTTDAQKTESLTVGYGEAAPVPEGGSWFGNAGIRKTVALTQFVIGARKVCELHQNGQVNEAMDLMGRTRALIEAEAAALGDAGLQQEAELAKALHQLLGGP